MNSNAAPDSADGQLHLLSAERPFAEAVAAWLLEHFSAERLGELVVAVPGVRSRELLLEALERGLAQAGREADAPPEVLSGGQLGDRLARPEPGELLAAPELAAAQRPVAARPLRSLLWLRALTALPARRRALLLPRASETTQALRATAASLRSLHAELARADRDAEDLLAALEPGDPNRRRWELFDELRTQVLAQLESLGFADPHEQRRRSSRLPARGVADVVLAGFVDPEALGLMLEAQLAHRVERTHVLLPGAPDAHAAHSSLGRLRDDVLLATERGLDLSAWRVLSDPTSSAGAARDWLAMQLERPDTGRVAACLRDEDVTTHLRGTLASEAIGLSELSGRRWTRSPAGRLLRLLTLHLEQRDFASFAALSRHASVEAFLEARLDELGQVSSAPPAALLDAYQAEHLPRGLPRPWSRTGFGGHERADELERIESLLAAWIGELGAEPMRPAQRWCAELRRLLAELLPPALAAGQPLESFALLLEPLAGFEAWPASAPALHGGEFLSLLLESLAARSLPVEAVEPALPTLAFEDLLFEDVDALLLAGFEARTLPTPVRRHPWIDDDLATDLGLPTDDARLAHAFWVLRTLQDRGVSVQLLSSRHGGEGEPRLPSRAAFLGSEEQALAAAARVWATVDEPPAAPPDAAPATREFPRRAATAPRIERLAVTAFSSFLVSPYQCYLSNVLGVRAADDRAREMDALSFGTLAHDVLESFGRDHAELQGDGARLGELFSELLDAHARQRFGRTAHSAVRIQLEQLRARLRAFATAQASWYAQGWRLQPELVEWAPESGGVAFDVDGEVVQLTGRIDRIDRHEESGAWALLDYKTSEKASTPRAHHGPRKNGRWESVQLPLYRLLVAELELSGPLQTGIVSLPADRGGAGFRLDDWEPQELDDALETAREVVRRLRRGEVSEVGTGFGGERSAGFEALSGVGLMGGPRERAPAPLLTPPEDDDAASTDHAEGAS